ncbi:hypothetical protein K2Z83_05420 [Oscillochloris sp. ZM17-4]|uniref:hypothetical protein n=1 Tax=Oscillochloris sp. ZM17-4 TaxID=2866714 RepID=UPI001C72BF42|nr:hypothetical protein [Oscillochloris sp. ZM17-4]MBX0327121.1 hypothetical protein [Oscillochloris sp. ZM17-4]
MLLLILALAGCAAPAGLASDSASGGGPTPEGVVESFIEDLNSALRDPSLGNVEARRGWAERLAGYFAPGERVDQRAAFSDTLAGFADTSTSPVVGTKATLEITYSRAELLSRSGDEALVRVVDGAFNLRWLDDTGEVLRERTGSLAEVIGQKDDGLPVIEVGGLWFLTER